MTHIGHVRKGPGATAKGVGDASRMKKLLETRSIFSARPAMAGFLRAEAQPFSSGTDQSARVRQAATA